MLDNLCKFYANLWSIQIFYWDPIMEVNNQPIGFTAWNQELAKGTGYSKGFESIAHPSNNAHNIYHRIRVPLSHPLQNSCNTATCTSTIDLSCSLWFPLCEYRLVVVKPNARRKWSAKFTLWTFVAIPWIIWIRSYEILIVCEYCIFYLFGQLSAYCTWSEDNV